jgi:hypothetical protein
MWQPAAATSAPLTYNRCEAPQALRSQEERKPE